MIRGRARGYGGPRVRRPQRTAAPGTVPDGFWGHFPGVPPTSPGAQGLHCPSSALPFPHRGGSPSVQAGPVTQADVLALSLRFRRKPMSTSHSRPRYRHHRHRGRPRFVSRNCSAGVVASACMDDGKSSNTGSPGGCGTATRRLFASPCPDRHRPSVPPPVPVSRREGRDERRSGPAPRPNRPKRRARSAKAGSRTSRSRVISVSSASGAEDGGRGVARAFDAA